MADFKEYSELFHSSFGRFIRQRGGSSTTGGTNAPSSDWNLWNSLCSIVRHPAYAENVFPAPATYYEQRVRSLFNKYGVAGDMDDRRKYEFRFLTDSDRSLTKQLYDEAIAYRNKKHERMMKEATGARSYKRTPGAGARKGR